jgi:hypothetical protein
MKIEAFRFHKIMGFSLGAYACLPVLVYVWLAADWAEPASRVGWLGAAKSERPSEAAMLELKLLVGPLAVP